MQVGRRGPAQTRDFPRAAEEFLVLAGGFKVSTLIVICAVPGVVVPEPLMKELAEILNRRRYKRGAIDFDLPEPLILFDEQGAMTGIRRSERLFAHRIIEEFMLAANEAVAGHLEAHLEESIYRVHEPPDPARVADFEELALRFGHTLGIGAIPVKRYGVVDRKSDGRKIRKDIVRADERLQVTSQMYQRLVEKLAGLPEERMAEIGEQPGSTEAAAAHRNHQGSARIIGLHAALEAVRRAQGDGAHDVVAQMLGHLLCSSQIWSSL